MAAVYPQTQINVRTVTNPATNTNLTFDGCGNQTSLNGGGTFVVDYLNEYTTFNSAPVTNDNDGDVLTYNNWTYTYDAQNRLTAAALSGITIATFYYDGLNRQIAREISGLRTFSVWDGDWAVLEEYGSSNAVQQKYLQGYHGLVKTLQNNVYYYQDELASTSHIASSSGSLLENYQYDLYGTPRVYNSSGVYQPGATPQAKDLGDGGARWINELGLYDDRNRFMSPALGRFIQPDPIGFKGDPSNLYRYCGNDWANRTDPTGLTPEPYVPITNVDPAVLLRAAQKDLARLKAEYNARLQSYGATILGPLKNQINQLQQSSNNQNAESGQVMRVASKPQNAPKDLPKINQNVMQVGLSNLKKAIGDSDDTQKIGYTEITDLHGHFQTLKSVSTARLGGWFKEVSPEIPEGWVPVVNSHVHPKGSWSFSGLDKGTSRQWSMPVFKNHDTQAAFGDIFYQEHEWSVQQNGSYAGDIR